MIERRLARQLERVAARFRRLRLWVSLAIVWMAAALAGVALLGLNRATGLYFPHSVSTLCSVAFAAVLVCLWMSLRSVQNYRWVAQRVETVYPELRSCLLAAVEQRPQLPNGRFGFLQDSVIEQSVRHGYRHAWHRAVPAGRLWCARLAHLVAFVTFACMMFALALYAAPRSTDSLSPLAERTRLESLPFSVTIEPGNWEVERGTSMLVTANFTGPVPAEAALAYQTADIEQIQLSMSKSLDDPVFGARIPSIDQELTYHVQFGQQQSAEFHVTVFDYPRLNRADAQLVYPGYTSMEQRLVQDVRNVSVIEGTQVTLICYLNKKVAEARLVEKEETPVELTPDGADETIYRAEFVQDRSRRFELKLVDEEGRSNKQPPEFVFNALPNRPPDLKLVQPMRDVQVSPLEELSLKANVWDDYGLRGFGVTYAMAGASPQDLPLGQSAAAKQRVDLDHLVAMEDLQAQPDQLLSYHFWAEDTGPDGEARRVFSDMFFAEVRHFEEIFRQGQQPPGGEGQQQQPGQGGGNQQAAQEIAELQKEIINATWNLIRRETADKPSEKFTDDAALVAQSQASAIDRVDVIKERIQDPQSQAHVQEVSEHMMEAFKRLVDAKNEPSSEPLPSALSAEQAAYQALLRLRAREYQVVRSNRQQQQGGGGGGGSSSRSQQQLQQLELTDDENRYETQRTAQSGENESAREDRQVLNRLRELARRQTDLNERLKELQSALEQAQTEQERQEIERRLKRLRDEQQEILRDTDELSSRMETPENQQRMSEAREQLENTRENLRQASEALQEGRVSRAAAAGTRAEREFEQLREEFRNRASGQFDEDMRDMRQAAEELDRNEQELSEQLSQLDDPDAASPGLSDRGPRENIQDELEQQQQRLSELLEQMRQTVEDAEQTEPLLAEQLYDTIRNAQQQELPRALDITRESLERGFVEDAREQEQAAREGIGELRRGVDRAAENVLGDETEALRRAQQELDDLADQLGEELAQADPRQQQDDPRNQDAENQQPGRAGRPGEQREQPNEPREQNTDGQQAGSQGSQGEPRESNQPGGQPGNQSSGRSENDADASPPNDQPGRQGGSRGRGNDSRRRGGRRGGASGPGGNVAVDPRTVDPADFDTLWGDDVPAAPIAGEDFVPWSDRLRDVEEMLDDPELRAEAARIRDRARGIRQDLKRHSEPPNWDLVRTKVFGPLVELRDRVAEELLKRTTKDATVPIDRDPVPPKYAEQVRKYYQQLGSGR